MRSVRGILSKSYLQGGLGLFGCRNAIQRYKSSHEIGSGPAQPGNRNVPITQQGPTTEIEKGNVIIQADNGQVRGKTQEKAVDNWINVLGLG